MWSFSTSGLLEDKRGRLGLVECVLHEKLGGKLLSWLIAEPWSDSLTVDVSFANFAKNGLLVLQVIMLLTSNSQFC
jgi:hypothetical protein